jgi:His/Glu/Gln/Arg/opine family amino acid ABC transporter permease subunit
VILFDPSVVRDYGSVFLSGLMITTMLTLVVIMLAGVLAIPLALARMSRARKLRWPADFFVEFIRATPLILQLIYLYYVLPSAGIRLDAISTAILGLTVNYSAYMSEVYRGGIEAIPSGQWEAARSLGLRPWPILRKIILPQAFVSYCRRSATT